MPRRRLLTTGAALILSILAYICTMALIQPSVASAHAYVIGSDPVDGSTVAKAPKEVHIYFNAAVSPLSSAHVYFTRGGGFTDVGATSSYIAPLNAQELVIPVKTPNTQPRGNYEVIWTAVANDDGHTTEGIIGFNVVSSSFPFTGTPILGPSTSNKLEEIHTLDLTALLAILWEWLVFIALTAWIGIVVMEQFVLMDSGHGTALLAQLRKHTYSLQRLCLATMLFGECVSLFLRVIHLEQVQQSDDFPLALSLSMITETNYGHIWLLRIVLVALTMGLLNWTHQSRKNRLPSESAQIPADADPQSLQPTQEAQTADTGDSGKLKEPAEAMSSLAISSHRVAWLLLAGLLTLLFVLTGPAAQVLQPHFSAILFDWLKNVAQGIWFGSFAYLSYALLPLLRTKNRDYDAETLVTLQQRLTPVLLASISIQLLSLIFLSDTSIHNLQQLHTDPYGSTLAVQLIIIVIIVLLSSYILFILRPRIMRQAQLLSSVEGEVSDVDADAPKRVRTLSGAKALDTGADLSGENVGTRFIMCPLGIASMGRRLKITTDILSALGIAVLLCSALMSFFAPPIVFPDVTYTNPPESPTTAVNTQTKQIGPFSVTLDLLPGHIGQSNTLILLINDRNGKPVTDAQVQLTTNMQIMDMGTGHALITGGNPVYATTFDQHQAFSMGGPWTINVEI